MDITRRLNRIKGKAKINEIGSPEKSSANIILQVKISQIISIILDKIKYAFFKLIPPVLFPFHPGKPGLLFLFHRSPYFTIFFHMRGSEKSILYVSIQNASIKTSGSVYRPSSITFFASSD